MRKTNSQITNQELEEQIDALRELIDYGGKNVDIYNGVQAAYGCILKHGGVKSWGQDNIERERIVNVMASTNPENQLSAIFYDWASRAYAGVLLDVLFVDIIKKDSGEVSYELNEQFIKRVNKYEKEVIKRLEKLNGY